MLAWTVKLLDSLIFYHPTSPYLKRNRFRTGPFLEVSLNSSPNHIFNIQIFGLEEQEGLNVCWCRRGDLNPHRDYSPLDPESSASTNSATSAALLVSIENYNLLFYIFIHKVKFRIDFE